MKPFWVNEIRCEGRDWKKGDPHTCVERLVGYYDNLEEATKALKEAAANHVDEEGYYSVGFQILKSRPVPGHPDCTEEEYCWSYDMDGNYITESSLVIRRKFYGRYAEDCPFHKGDLVFSYNWGYITIGVITAVPKTPEEINAIKAECDRPWLLDGSDDCFRVDFDDEDDHEHVQVTHAFPCKIKL